MNDFKTCPHASLVQEERERTGYVCRDCGAQADERVWHVLSEAKERIDGLTATVAEYEVSIRSHMTESDFFVETAELAAKALLAAEWTEHGGPVYSCTGCASGWSFQRVHTPTCRVDAALTRLGYPDLESRARARAKLRDDDFKERWQFPSRSVDPAPKPPPQTEPQRFIPDSPSSDPEFDSDPDDGGD